MDEGSGAASPQAGARTSRVREIDPDVIEAPVVDVRLVTCEPCGLMFNESVEAHLARCHPNVMFPIDVEPASGTATVRRPTSIGFFNKFGG